MSARAIQVDYESSQTVAGVQKGFACGVLLWLTIGYLVVCTITVPFMDSIWFGEIPLLALPQVPKTSAASLARRHVVMPVIRAAGLSRGSASPDMRLARPYALAIVYVVPVGALLIATWMRTRMRGRYGWLAVAVLLVAVTDYIFTLVYAGGPGLSIY
jgi:hypothetical protein